MAENEQGQTPQQTQGQNEQNRQQQTQGQTSRGIQRQQGGGQSSGMTSPRIFSPSLFSVSPFTLLAASPFALIRQFTEEIEQLAEDSGTVSSGASAQQGRAGSGKQRTGTNLGQPIFSPQVDVFERDGQLVVRVDLPGVSKDNVRVEMTDDALIIEGERRYEHEENQGGVYRVERSYGTFRRQIPLPEGVNAQTATATFRNGVLEIAMQAPQARSRSRQLEIKDEGQTGEQQTRGATAGYQS
jgi:HSP20 family protein